MQDVLPTKKILFITEDYIKGGVAIVSQNLSKVINRREHYCFDTLLLNAYSDYAEVNRLLPALNPDKASNKITKLWRLVSDTYKLAKILPNYDIILINGDLFQVVIPVWIVSKFFKKIQVFAWIHVCLNKVKYYPNFLIKILHIYGLLSFRNIITVSNAARDGLLAYMNRPSLPNISVINNFFECIDVEHIPLSNVFPQDAVKLIVIGRLVPEKNIAMILQAMHLLSRYNLFLVICGDGPEKQNLSNIVSQLALENRVQFVGQVNNPLSYLKASDILISSSNTEALPTVVIEAFMCKKLVIATKTGAAEILNYGEYGTVIDINDVSALANAIYQLSSKPVLGQKYIKMYSKALQNYTESVVLDKWISLFTNANQ